MGEFLTRELLSRVGLLPKAKSSSYYAHIDVKKGFLFFSSAAIFSFRIWDG